MSGKVEPAGARIASLALDIRHAIRGLQRSPGFTSVAVLTLAIGIGVNAAVFTVTNAALFKGFPLVRDNDRLVYITTNRTAVYYPDFEEWRTQAGSFDGMALVRGVFKTFSGDGGAPATYFTTEVSANTFQLLGATPVLGRDFLASDQEPGAEPVVILRNDLWRSRFGGSPAIVGQTVRLNGVATTVVGVMPRGFSFPEDQSLWTPLVPTAAALRREAFYARYAFARLASDASVASARAEMDTMGHQLASRYPRTNRDVTPELRDFRAFFVGRNGTIAYEALWGAVGFVLLIACVVSVDAGFRSDKLLTMSVNVPRSDNTEAKRLDFYRRLFPRLEQVPGVTSVGGVTRLPLGGANSLTEVAVEGRIPPDGQWPQVDFRRALHDYFETMGIPLRRGRAFDEPRSVGCSSCGGHQRDVRSPDVR